MKIEFTIEADVNAPPQEIYTAWLNSEQHTAMTGGEAHVSNIIGDTFEAWDGYITGKNMELETNKRIVQRWRTTEFDESAEDSLLEIGFEESETGTLITLIHSNLPEHGLQYKQGWIDAYFTPMKSYFKIKK